MAVSLLDLRRDIGRQMNDLLTLTADSGSNNMLVDPVELTDFDGTFVGSQGVVVSAAVQQNLGKVVRVVGNSQSGTSISFTPPLPGPIMTGDEIDLHNLRGRGFRVQDYNQAIKSVIKQHGHRAPRPIDSSPIKFDIQNPFLEIPEEWVAVHGASVLIDGYTYDIHHGRYDGARGWRLDQTGKRIEISGSDRYAAEGLDVVLHGYRTHPDVNVDSDMIYLSPEFVAKTVMSNLAQRRGDTHWNQWAAEWAQMAAGIRPATIPAWPPNTVMVAAS